MADEVQPVAQRAESSDDRWSYRMIIVCLGAVLLSAMGGIIGLSIVGKDVPAELPPLVTMVVGVLAAILKAPGTGGGR
jgi:hypothetical protein